MLSYTFSVVCGMLPLLIILMVEHGKRCAAEARAKLLEKQLICESDRHGAEVEHYQAAIDKQQIIINDLSMKLAARTWDDARQMEPNVITSVRRTDAELVKIAREKARQDKDEDKVYEQIGHVI